MTIRRRAHLLLHRSVVHYLVPGGANEVVQRRILVSSTKIQVSWENVEVLPDEASKTSRDRLLQHVRHRRQRFRRFFVALPGRTAGAVLVNGSEVYMDGSSYFAYNSAVDDGGIVCKSLGAGGSP